MNSNKGTHRNHVLVAVLDWGLGHATRSIPLIRNLLNRGCQVSVASSGDAILLLKTEFREIEFFELPSYKASYSATVPLILKILVQLPKFLFVIQREHKQLQEIVKQHDIDFVISDNRYGCWTKQTPTVIISHQVNVMVPAWLSWIRPVVNYFNHNQIKRFDQCWIPDYETNSITGKLTYPLQPNCRYIGLLSRFRRRNNPLRPNYDLAAIISGPEPQRSIFEKKIINQIQDCNLKAIVLRGKMGEGIIENTDKILFKNHLAMDRLQEVLEQSTLVVCRSGYSSIMDLVALEQKQVLFVPTPGQTEQEYLAKTLLEKRVAFFQDQDDLNLETALTEIKKYSGFVGCKHQPNLLEEALNEILE